MVGVEMAQVFVRVGVRVRLVEGGYWILRGTIRSRRSMSPTRSWRKVSSSTWGSRPRVPAGGAGPVAQLSDGSTVEGAELLVAVGRRPADLRALGVEDAGATLDDRGSPSPDDQMR